MLAPIEWVVGATTVLTGTLAWLAWRQRPRPGATAFAVAAVGVTWWIGMFFLGRVALAVEAGHAWFLLATRLEWAGTHVMTVAWFCFALVLTGRGEYVTRRVVALVGLFPALSYPVALASADILNPAASALGLGRPLPPGFGHWFSIEPFQTSYVYAVLLATSLLVVGHVLLRRQPHPERAILWLLAIAPPWILNALYVFGFSGYFWPFELQLDPTPFGFVGTVAVGLLLIGRFDGLQATPVARAYVVDQLDTGVVVVDDEFRVVDYNDWADGALDLPADVVGRDVAAVVADATDATLDDGAADAAADDPADGGIEDDPAAWLDGRTVRVGQGRDARNLSIEVSPLQRPGSTVQVARGSAVVLRDVTARIERERALETQNEQLELLNQLVHHDIRNEMGLLLEFVRRARRGRPGVGATAEFGNADGTAAESGTADAAAAGDSGVADATADDPADEFLDRAEESGERVLSLAEAAHSLVRAVVRSAEELEAVPLVPTLEREVANATMLDADATVAIDGPLPDVDVLANELLASVFRNLLSNAVQHAGDDGVRVTVSAAVEDGRVLVRVADDGPGIPDEHVDDVFGKSYAYSESAGTGLGLYLVRTLVDDYGGDVRIEDSGPDGTVFVVALRPATGGDGSPAVGSPSDDFHS